MSDIIGLSVNNNNGKNTHPYKINIQKAYVDNDRRCWIAIKFQIPLFIRQKLGHKLKVIAP